MAVEWSDIPNKLKVPIIGLLDYESRCNMRLCSRNDKLVVDSVDFLVAKSVKMDEVCSPMDEEKTTVRIDIDTFTIWLIGKNNVTRVEKGWNGEVDQSLSEIKQEERHEVARRYLDRFFTKGPLITDSLTILDFNVTPSENWAIECGQLNMRYLTENRDFQWMDNVKSEKLRKLHLTRHGWPEITVHPLFMKVTESLQVVIPIDMTDEQLDQLKATDMSLVSPNFTADGVIRKLEWFLKNSKKKDTLEIRVLLGDNYDYMELIPAGVTAESSQLRDDQYYSEAKLLGGFENIHGIHDTRTLTVWKRGENTVVKCEIEHKHWGKTFVLWPFTKK